VLDIGLACPRFFAFFSFGELRTKARKGKISVARVDSEWPSLNFKFED
jgi:hypothetical protein